MSGSGRMGMVLAVCVIGVTEISGHMLLKVTVAGELTRDDTTGSRST